MIPMPSPRPRTSKQCMRNCTATSNWRSIATSGLSTVRPFAPAPRLADIQRGLARCSAAQGDRDGARSWARRAVETLDRWPGVGLDESIRLLRNLGGRPAPSRLDGLLSDREIQVAALVSRGFTNREIGEELHIAPRTVGVHVSHILGKLRVSRRSEIATYVARRSVG